MSNIVEVVVQELEKLASTLERSKNTIFAQKDTKISNEANKDVHLLLDILYTRLENPTKLSDVQEKYKALAEFLSKSQDAPQMAVPVQGDVSVPRFKSQS